MPLEEKELNKWIKRLEKELKKFLKLEQKCKKLGCIDLANEALYEQNMIKIQIRKILENHLFYLRSTDYDVLSRLKELIEIEEKNLTEAAEVHPVVQAFYNGAGAAYSQILEWIKAAEKRS